MSPELAICAIILLSLVLYAVFAGADFGAGIWEFTAAFQASKKERSILHQAIQPVWEANHVWLIFVLVLLLNAFPLAFSALFRALWLPLLLALAGIIFRGAGFAFRPERRPRTKAAAPIPKAKEIAETESSLSRQQAIWEAVFALGSTAAPFFLGASAGAVASGRLPLTATGEFQGDYLTAWVTPLGIFAAFFGVGGCAFLAATYLARESTMHEDAEQTSAWRQRALSSGVWMGILVAAGLALMAVDAPALWAGIKARAWPLVVLAAIAGSLTQFALWKRWFNLAVLCAPAAVGAVVCAWGVAQYPALIPPAITVDSAKAPPTVLWPMLWSVAVGAALITPSLAWLLWLFKGEK